MMNCRIIVIMLMILMSCSEERASNDSRTILGKDHARKVLQQTLRDSSLHNVVNKNTLLLRNEATVVAMVEPLLFSIYGQTGIRNQRPYEAYRFGKYWVVVGTLPKQSQGGTFLVVLNAVDGRVVRLSHGK